MVLDFLLNTHPNSYVDVFNSHMCRMLGDVAQGVYVQDKADDYSEIMKLLGKEPDTPRSLGEFRLALKLAEFVLGAHEALLGVKEKALQGVLLLMAEFNKLKRPEQEQACFYRDLTLITMTLLSSNFNAHHLL